MRKYFLAAAMVLSSAAVPQCATAGGKSAPVAFKATRMVNLTYPFFAVEGSPPQYKKWSAAEVKKILSVIAGSGFESVKLNVDPAPLLAEKNGLRDHLPEFESIIKEISGAHLSVIFDLQPQPLPEDQIQNLGSTDEAIEPAASPQSFPPGERYVALVAELAKFLSGFDPGHVTFEIGTPAASEKTRENRQFIRKLFLAARQSAPSLTLIVDENGKSLSATLKDLQPSDFDWNSLISFRYFVPVVFTKQGEQKSDSYRHYVQHMPYPPDRSNFHDQMNQFRASLEEDSTLTEARREILSKTGVDKLSIYFGQPEDFKFMQAQFKELSDWATHNKIAPDRILIGAFGAERSSDEHPGVDPEDRARWMLNVRTLADRCGFRWAVWQVGLEACSISSTASLSGPLDPRVLRSLGLR